MKCLSLFAPAVLLALPAESNAQGGQDQWRTDFSNHTVPLDEIVSGGPPKDGIPAIDSPSFVSVSSADEWIGDREPVAVIEIGEIARVYPLQILIWHEIVNDRIGNTPVSVTFYPLCNTTLAFDRRFEGRVLDFGTTGRVRHSDLVMYDRQTETWWQQASGRGIVGELAGSQLTFIGAPVVSWSDVKETLPHAEVLSRETGYRRNYGQSPYRGYDNLRTGRPMRNFFRRALDRRLDAMERVVTVSVGATSAAYPFRFLEDNPVINDELEDTRIVIFWAPGTASALDSRDIARGREVGSGAAYSPSIEGEELEFESIGDGRFRDRQTGSEWNVLGKAVSGPMSGKRLAPVPHGNHFWFSWAVFSPETEIRN
jgi:hypothetical protein